MCCPFVYRRDTNPLRPYGSQKAILLTHARSRLAPNLTIAWPSLEIICRTAFNHLTDRAGKARGIPICSLKSLMRPQ